MSRLSRNHIASLPPQVRRPGYAGAKVDTGIVHLGVGAFHRAHQAAYMDQIIAAGDTRWGIAGVSLRNPAVRDQLQPQDGLYTLVEQSAAGQTYRLIGSVQKVLVAPEDPAAVLALLAREKTYIVSLTITEKGYCHDPANGNLNFSHPAIRHDLAHPAAPQSAVGFIVYALRDRLARGIRPFTPLTCDNLPGNGALLKKIVLQFACQIDRELARQIEAELRFPCTMVDRIVPATTEQDKLLLGSQLGYRDEAMVKTEPFSQWVIEDNFVNQRPALEHLGVNLVADVRTFEDMKLRLLNGSHSAIAYLGYLAGLEYVHQVIAHAEFKTFIQAFMDEEVTPSLVTPDGIDLDHYKAALIARFANPALNHRTHQIAMDGSQKLPQRLLNTVRVLIDRQLPYRRISLALAAWIRYVSGRDDAGNSITVQDPMSPRLQAIAAAHCASPPELIEEIIGINAIFGTDLNANIDFKARLLFWYQQLAERGTLSTLEHFDTLCELEGAR